MKIVSIIAGVIYIAIGVAVFAIRLGHPGPYALPGGAAFIGAIVAIVLGGYLFWPGKPRFTGLVAGLIATVASFPAIYSIVGESEEVISLYAIGPDNQPADLRLWIVDRDDGAWVGMGRNKAVTHNLDGAKLEMLRHGQIVCVMPKLYDDLETASQIHAMKIGKYKAAQMAVSLGMYPPEAGPNTVALRMDPCESLGSE